VVVQSWDGTSASEEEHVKARLRGRKAEGGTEEEDNGSHIRVEQEETAHEIITMLEDGADVATLAQEKSTGPSGPRGGELGWFGKGQMVPEFEQAVIGLENGAISAPIQTQFGWHVVKRNDSRNKAAPTLDEVRAEIINTLKSEAVEAAVESVTAAAEITRVEVEIDPAMIRKVELLSE